MCVFSVKMASTTPRVQAVTTEPQIVSILLCHKTGLQVCARSNLRVREVGIFTVKTTFLPIFNLTM